MRTRSSAPRTAHPSSNPKPPVASSANLMHPALWQKMTLEEPWCPSPVPLVSPWCTLSVPRCIPSMHPETLPMPPCRGQVIFAQSNKTVQDPASARKRSCGRGQKVDHLP